MIEHSEWVSLTAEELEEFCDFNDDLVDRWGTTQIVKASVSIPPLDSVLLRNCEPAIVEKYNSFDIWLKDEHEVNVVVFINYDEGTVWLMKPESYEFD